MNPISQTWPKRVHESIVRGFLAMFLLFNGCKANSGDSIDINTALISVQSDPPIQYILNQFSLQMGTLSNMPFLKWTSSNPIASLQASLQLIEGSSSLFIFSYYLPGPRGDILRSFDRNCQDDCQGLSTVAIDINQRKMLVDLSMNFAADIDVCSTRYCVTVAADQSNIYATCKDHSECKSIFEVDGCRCTKVLPCKGNVARDASELCPNSDFRTDKLSINVTAHVELSQDMLQSE